MNKDIRISIGFLDHPKTIKLKRKLGVGAVDSLMRLWFFAAQYKPSGELTGMDVDAIEIAAKWEGEEGKFIKTLLSLRWLDEINGIFCLHDWAEHNGYVAHADARSEKARKAAEARWGKKDATKNEHKQAYATSNATSINEQCYEHMQNPKQADAPSPSPTPTPTPNPSPSLLDKSQDQPPSEAADADPSSNFSDELPFNIPDQLPGKKPNHFSVKVGDFFKSIKASCETISSFPNNGHKPFNPYQWVQRQCNDGRHPGAIDETIRALAMPDIWTGIRGDPWAYANSIMKTKNQNWNERESVEIHKEFKKMSGKELVSLTYGIMKRV